MAAYTERAEVVELGEGSKKVRSVRALQGSYIQHQILWSQLPLSQYSLWEMNTSELQYKIWP